MFTRSREEILRDELARIPERIDRGVHWLDTLDSFCPPWHTDTQTPMPWRDVIDQSVLNMRDCSECVLGQLFGSYNTGIGYLLGNTYAYGFAAPSFAHYGDGVTYYNALRNAWIEVINNRQRSNDHDDSRTTAC